MLNWAVARGLIDHSPAAAMQEDDAGSLASVSWTRKRLPRYGLHYPASSDLLRWRFKLALVTGQRIGEVCGMTEES